MSTYFLLYLIIIIILLIFGLDSLKKTRYSKPNIFLSISLFSYSIWLILYLCSFTLTYNKIILLNLSRFMYGMAFLAMYSMLFYIINFGNKKIYKIKTSATLLIIICLLSFFSPFIIKDMVFDTTKEIYHEKFGILFGFYSILYVLFAPIFLHLSYLKYKKLTLINKSRIKYIILGYMFLFLNHIIFLAILPSFGIWILQKEQIVFFIPFIVLLIFSVHKYNFLDIKIFLGKIINFLGSIFLTIIIVYILKEHFLNHSILIKIWGVSEKFGIFDLTLGILIFTLTHFLTKKYIIGESEYYYLSKNITKLKRKIAFINNLSSLNILLNKEFSKLFKTNYASIEVYREKTGDLRGLKEYFLKDKSYKLFINDIVFIEENKNKFDYKKIHEEITDKSYLIFGLINNNREFIGIFKMGPKLFQDGYTQEEVDLISDFVDFLIGHLKYIEIYSQIHDLNVNLDKKIDEKTIEFNNLLNRQNDFISLASHEIKSPLGSCIFQFDCLIDDLKEKNIDADILESIEKLNKKLAKVGELTKTIFSVQKFDLGKMKLFKQKVDLNFLLEDKIEFHQKSNVNITFIKQIKNNIGEINVDRIQFEQVLDNLINNAIKFCNKNEPKILIKAFKEKENVIIEVEDNGEGLSQEELEKIFDKYSTGESNSIGLGMGLYLCKKIVELHVGNISAGKGKNLLGACFKIKIPKMID